MDLLQRVGAKGSIIRITAWDDYVAEIALDLIQKYDLLLATHADGRELTIEDQGPFFVIFPFSQYKELRKDLHYGQSVWQVRNIEVE